VPRPYTGLELEVGESWIPYPLPQHEVPAYFRRRADEFANLTTLTDELTALLYGRAELDSPALVWHQALELSTRLVMWHRHLPVYLAAREGAAAHILTLQ